MQDETLQQYSRQMVLPQIGHDGQQALLDAHVLIIGLGGLGSPAAMYLAAAGTGQLTLCDYDRVDITNLHRQILYGHRNLGQKKTTAAHSMLLDLQPQIKIETIDHKMEMAELETQVEAADLVLDCSDNFQTRYQVNAASVNKRTPLISAAAIRMQAQIAVFNHDNNGPCYACLYGANAEEEAQQRCSENGVLGPLVGIAGSMQALEAIKLITQTGESLSGRLLTFNAETMQWHSSTFKKDPACPVCTSQSIAT